MRAAGCSPSTTALAASCARSFRTTRSATSSDTLACSRRCSDRTWMAGQAMRLIRASGRYLPCCGGLSPVPDDRPHRNVLTSRAASAGAAGSRPPWPGGRTSVPRLTPYRCANPIMRRKPAAAPHCTPRMRARRSAAMPGYRDTPGAAAGAARCPMGQSKPAYDGASVTHATFPGQPGHSKAPWTIRQDHPGGKAPATGPTMQASTANSQHDRGSPVPAQVPPELLETVARALAAALVPPPRQPEPSR
jgi:hypothetical protein